MSIQLFSPCSSDHGEWFHEQFCYKCAKNPHSLEAKSQCMIWMSAMAFQIEDKEYPNQWRYVDGKPVCTAFKDREEFNRERRLNRKGIISSDKFTLDIFNSGDTA